MYPIDISMLGPTGTSRSTCPKGTINRPQKPAPLPISLLGKETAIHLVLQLQHCHCDIPHLVNGKCCGLHPLRSPSPSLPGYPHSLSLTVDSHHFSIRPMHKPFNFSFWQPTQTPIIARVSFLGKTGFVSSFLKTLQWFPNFQNKAQTS